MSPELAQISLKVQQVGPKEPQVGPNEPLVGPNGPPVIPVGPQDGPIKLQVDLKEPKEAQMSSGLAQMSPTQMT